MSILVVGTVALDTVETPFGKVKDVLGGSATYFALSARFFSKVKLVAIVGKDFPPKFIRFLQTRKIDLQGLEVKQGKTFRWRGRYTYDFNSAQTIKTELNLLAHFNPVLPSNYQNEKFVFLANVDPQIQLKVLSQLRSPQLIVADTMNYWIEHKLKPLKRVVKKSDILILNDAEAREFSQESNLIKAAKWLLRMGPSLVVIKRGEYGCLLIAPNFLFCIPAYLLENVLDPTGAGDTFAGGFLGYLAHCPRITESAFKKAIVYGSVMASYAVEEFSLNRLKKLDRRDIGMRMRKLQQMTKF